MSENGDRDHPRGGVLYQPTEEQRRLVKVMSGFGIPQPDIAAQIGIDAKTLRKHFREELDRGMTEANMRVAQSLFNMATTGNNVAAAIFWMKARAGWREKHEVVVSDKLDPTQVTRDEADALLAEVKAGIAEYEANRSPRFAPAIDGVAARASLSHSASFYVPPVHHRPTTVDRW